MKQFRIKKLFLITSLLLLIFVLSSSATMALTIYDQVYSQVTVNAGDTKPKTFLWSFGNFVPSGLILSVSTISITYTTILTSSTYVDILGRDSAGNVKWRLQHVRVEPNQTNHLTFPSGLCLGAGGRVDINNFGLSSPNYLEIELNAQLVY